MGVSRCAVLLLLAVVCCAAAGARAASTTPCSVTVDENGAGGSVYIYVTITSCRVAGRATLTLRDAKTRRLLKIRGNPISGSVQLRTFRHGRAVLAFVWQNYCGPGRPLLVQARFATRLALERDRYPGARCDVRSQPSTIRPFRLPGG